MAADEAWGRPLHRGMVKFYNPDKGWGAITSDALPVGRDAWVHFSALSGTSYRSLAAGQPVEFAFEAVRQDSFEYRATVVKPLE